MTEKAFQSAREALLAEAKKSHGLLSAEEVVHTALAQGQEVTQAELHALVESLGHGIQMVEQARKEQILASLTPEKPSEALVDLSLMDKILEIVLHKQMPEELRREWQTGLAENPLHLQILALRPDMRPEAIAEKLGLSLPELYFLERDMYNLYYPLAWKYRK